MLITKDSLLNAWSAARASLADAGDALFLERGLVHGPIGLSAVIRVADAKPGILLRVNNNTASTRWHTQKLAGVHFEPALRDRGTHVFPVLAADDEAINVFASFVADVAGLLDPSTPESDQWSMITDRISLWKRFFTRRKGALNEEEQRGLIGELLVLRALMVDRGIDNALEAWKGPAGELQDFHLPEYRVEVKTWTNTTRPEIYVSDAAQLVVDPVWPVWIAAIELTHDARGKNVGDYVTLLAETLAADHRVLFQSLLADVGFLAVHASAYTSSYAVREAKWFCVKDGFPLINRSAIPSAVTTLKYGLALSALASFAGPTPLGRLTV
jgi:hypothetical protein